MAEATPAPRASWTALLPGVVLCLLIAVLARSVHGALPSSVGQVVGEVVFAVALGLVAGNAFKLPSRFAPGIRFSFTTILRTAIVLLGASFSVQQVAAIGGRAVLMIVA